jgi:hypothetical protein
MRKLLAITALALSLSVGGCATQFGQKVEGVVSAITGATVDPQSVIVASNIFDGLERTATNYLRLKKCNGSTPICRDPGATKAIIPAIRSGRVARNNLQQFMTDHPGQLGPTGLYDALQSSINTLQSAFAQYNIGAGQ